MCTQNVRIMLHLCNFIKNHFDTSRISDERLKRFAEDHISCLRANNGAGDYDAMIAAIEPLYNGYLRSMQTEAGAFAMQVSYTRRVELQIAAFRRAVRQKEGLVRAHFDIDTPEYQHFFPQGLRPYTKATKGLMEIVMQQFWQTLQYYQSTIGTAVVQQFADLKNDYDQARRAQLEQKGKVELLATARQKARRQLERQLSFHLLQLAQIHWDTPDRYHDFFDQSLLEVPSAAVDAQQTGDIEPQTQQVVETAEIHADTILHIKNTGKTPMEVAIVEQASAVPTLRASLPLGAVLRIPALRLGANNKGTNLLHITNTAAGAIGSYRLRMWRRGRGGA